MDNPPAQQMGTPAQPAKSAMKPSGKNRMFGVMPIAVMAFAFVAFLVLIWMAIK